MIRSTAFASLAILAALATAPQTARAEVGNVVGGGGAELAGGGDDMRITYNSTGAGGGARYEQLGRSVAFAGNSGDSPVWTYGPAPAGNPGRAVRLIGGGGDILQVVDDRM
jgi:hypothetical protein